MDAVEIRVESYIARYSIPMAARIRAARKAMRSRLPGAVELVYDNYNALVFAYGADESQRSIVFSLAAYPRWVSLFFARGAGLNDAAGILKGAGARVRHIVLQDLAQLDHPDVGALMKQALDLADPPIDPERPGRTVIKSVSARQRPRAPS